MGRLRSNLALGYNDVEVGDTWVSAGRTVTETDVVQFAGLSGDFNPIHVNHDYASKHSFRQPIAHGLLGLSIASGLGTQSPLMRTEAFLSIQEWIFHKPIFFGDTINVRTTVVAVEIRAHGRRAIVTWSREVINQNQTIVQSGRYQTLVAKRIPNESDACETEEPNANATN